MQFFYKQLEDQILPAVCRGDTISNDALDGRVQGVSHRQKGAPDKEEWSWKTMVTSNTMQEPVGIKTGSCRKARSTGVPGAFSGRPQKRGAGG